MEFTKAEKKLLESSLTGQQRGQTILFIAGILFMIAGIGVWAYSFFLFVPSEEKSFAKKEDGISGMPVQTSQGMAMKQMLLESKKQIEQNRNAIVENGFNQASFYLLLVGFLLIIVHYENKAYQGLIGKLVSRTDYETPS
jgi:hypothetical protein